METGNVMLIRKIIMIPSISWVILIIKNRSSKGQWTRKIAQQEIENAQISSLNRLPDAILALKSKKLMV